jgi:hypothetical protein
LGTGVFEAMRRAGGYDATIDCLAHSAAIVALDNPGGNTGRAGITPPRPPALVILRKPAERFRTRRELAAISKVIAV